jgi:kynurenine formamidase
MQKRYSAPCVVGGAGIIWLIASGSAAAQYKVPDPGSVIDLSPTVSMSLKQSWPGGQRHHQPVIFPYIQHGASPYTADLIIVDNDTATQFDCPPHMMPDQDSGLPNAGYWGFMTCDKVPAWQMVGQVVKVDGRGIYDQAPEGESPIFTIQMVEQTEKDLGRELRPGDAVLYWSHYNDTRGAPGESPDRLQIDVLQGKAPAWPGPNFATSDYVGSKGVTIVGLDSPSIGAFGDPDHTFEGPQSYRSQTGKAIESHLGVFKHGGVDVEGLIHLDQVPNGSIFFGLPVKIQDTPTAQTRAAAITDPELADDLARAIRAHRVADLSVLNGDNLPVYWLGAGVGNFAFPFARIKELVNYRDYAPYWVNSQIMDSRTGTHLSPPAHYGLPPGFSINSYAPEIQAWAREFEQKYGPIQSTDVTSDKVPVEEMMGPARVIDVRHLAGTTDEASWPASPAITVPDVQAHEEQYGELRPGEVAIFQTGHTDAHFGPMLRGRLERTMKAPLDGETEGWPAVTPEVVRYLAGKGVKHIAIDAPSAGSVDPKERAMTYWSAANEGTIFTEYLIDVGQLPATGGFYVFLNPKIENNHGGPGRAIGILPVGTAQASN